MSSKLHVTAYSYNMGMDYGDDATLIICFVGDKGSSGNLLVCINLNLDFEHRFFYSLDVADPYKTNFTIQLQVDMEYLSKIVKY